MFGPRGIGMRTVVVYTGGEIDLPLQGERIVTAWDGPSGLDSATLAAELSSALSSPLDFPSLSLAIVPGDRVLLAVDPRLPEPESILGSVTDVLLAAGVDREAITVAVATGPNPAKILDAIASLGLKHSSGEFAYLATTNEGRRIYLNKDAADADLVLPIGVIAQSAGARWSGPWSTLDPGLTNDSMAIHSEDPQEISWLLGNQFQIGVVPGVSGVAAVIAGSSSSVLAKGIARAERVWTLRVDRRSELAILGLGEGAGLDSTWAAFATGASLVRRGGKVVVLSDASGSIGGATLRLSGADRFDSADTLLAGTEAEPDHASARLLCSAMAWADLYLWSRLDADTVEDLGITPLGNPREARRLAEAAVDVTLVNHAQWTRAAEVNDR